MQSERIPTRAEEGILIDRALLGLLLDPGCVRPWLADRIAVEMGARVATAGGLERLARVGLARRYEDVVFASPAAERARELWGWPGEAA
jgi:hypothetical protein